MDPHTDPYVSHLGTQVTITHTDGNTTHGHLWRLTPNLARVITDGDTMVEVDRAAITDMQPHSYELGDRVAITTYDGRYEATVVNIVPGLLPVRLDDGRSKTIPLPPPDGMTITSLRRATKEEQDALLAARTR